MVRRLRVGLVAENSSQSLHIVLATHGVLIALILQAYDSSVDYAFWAALTMPDIYALRFGPAGERKIRRLWPQAGGAG